MADIETPRSARRRRISEDIEHAGSDLAEGVLDSMVSRNPGPAGKLRALLERLNLVFGLGGKCYWYRRFLNEA